MSSRVHHGLSVPMRDGVELAADLLLPTEGGARPVVLYRTPYDKVKTRTGPSGLPQFLVDHGYAVVIGDCRGRFNSGGDFRPYLDEAEDGYDTVEWIAEQPWCDGNVGMLGSSYGAETQWYAASSRPPHLKAIVPICAGPATLWQNEPISGGCFRLPMAEWMVGMGNRSWVEPDWNLWTEDQPYFGASSLADIPRIAGTSLAWWEEWMDHPTFDDFWRAGSYLNFDEMDVASLNITGWWDSNSPGGPMNFQAMSASPAADRRMLVVGPWPHLVNTYETLSGVEFGEGSKIDLHGLVLRFYDRWLKGALNGIDSEPPVSYFLTGAGEWRTSADWPPSNSHSRWYLHSNGRANGKDGDGTLSEHAPSDEPTDNYQYDPTDPVKVIWNMHDGPVDDRDVLERQDCLYYVTKPLDLEIDVVGTPKLHLTASSSALDTDWHVRLVDVEPDGTTRFVCHGALRARFRESFETPTLLEPGVATEFQVILDPCGVRFQVGHRIGLIITSSWSTLYSPNTNSGSLNWFTDSDCVTATQRIYHQADLASWLALPVVESDRARS